MASFKLSLSKFRRWQQDSKLHIAQPTDEKHHCHCCDMDFVGNFWPDHDVGEKEMALLLDAYDKLKGAARAGLKLANYRAGYDGVDAPNLREDGSE